ncbi:MAG TPA: hypothetical protein VK213_05565 [Bacteroidales bacterium]|nr:hypothetical protein [Bacteroidales bacterium]
MKSLILSLVLLMMIDQASGQSDKNQQKETSDKSSGTKISVGSSGVKRSISYRFSSSSGESDPGNGTFSFDKYDAGQAGYLIADDIDLSGEDQSKWFSTWDDTTGATGRGQIILVDQLTDKTTILDVRNVFTREKGYWKIPVSIVSGSLPENGKVYFYIFNRIAKKKQEGKEQEAETVVIAAPPSAAPEPEPIAVVTPAPVIPEPQPVVEAPPTAAPEPEPVAVVTTAPVIPEPQPVVESPPTAAPEPEPIAVVEPVAVVTSPPSIPEPEPVIPAVTTVVTPAPVVAEPVNSAISTPPPNPVTEPVTPAVVVATPPSAAQESVSPEVITVIPPSPAAPEPEPVQPAIVAPSKEPEPVQPAIIASSKEPEPAQTIVVSSNTQSKDQEENQPVKQEPLTVVVADVTSQQAAPVAATAQNLPPDPSPVTQAQPVQPQQSSPNEVTAVQAPAVKNEEPAPSQSREPVQAETRPAMPAERLPVTENRRRPTDKTSTVDQNTEERLTQVSTVRQPAAQASAQPGSQPSNQPSVQPARQSSEPPTPANRQSETIPSQGTTRQEPATPSKGTTAVQPVQEQGRGQVSQVTEPRNDMSSAPPAYQPNLPVYQPVVNPYASGRGHGKCYSGIIEAGYGLGMGEYGMNNFRFNFINGFHIGPTFTVGLGLGLRKYYPASYTDRVLFTNKTRMPVFLDLRKRFSTRTVTPYMSFGIGNSISFIKEQDSTRSVNDGMMINASGGIWLNLSQRFGIFAGLAYESEKFEYVWLADDTRFKKNGGSVSINIGISF